jgi:hypothetical protein
MKIDVSRIVLLISLVALTVIISGADMVRFFSLSIPGNAIFWVGVALLIFYATRSGCCATSKSDPDESRQG